MERPTADIHKPAVDFVASYYDKLAVDPAGVGDLYTEGSWVTIQGETIHGKEGILAKLTSRPGCKRRITDFDCHSCDDGGWLLVFVNGVVDVVQQDGKQHTLNFCQTLRLMPTPQGHFYILNDIFCEAALPQSQVMEGVPANVATSTHT
ncbi:hypothetical protein ACJRO7_033200 [Eucalyptus globulus]|uniref:NTF2-related export protein n=1 Tax=Eucalyptus globulus TaxID=34317 RepID=A0ABD3JLD7_EUCGL